MNTAPTPGQALTPPGRVVNPVEVEQRILSAANAISAGVQPFTDALQEFREATRVYDQAYAKAYLQHRGPAHEKKYVAELETWEERERMDLAEVAFEYAKRQAYGADKVLSAFQTLNRSVTAMYGAAGTVPGL